MGDDDLPFDLAWLESLGFYHSTMVDWAAPGCPLIPAMATVPDGGRLIVGKDGRCRLDNLGMEGDGEVGLAAVRTRGDVRRMLAVFEIQVPAPC